MNWQPSPWPSSDAWRQAAIAEAKLAQVYQQAAGHLAADWCQRASELHQAQADVLAQPDPWGGYQTDHQPVEPWGALDTPVISDRASALAAQHELASQCLTAATSCLNQAVAGVEALLATSLVVSVCVDVDWHQGPSTVRPLPVPGSVLPSRINLGSDIEAAQAALSHAHELKYTLVTAAGIHSRGNSFRSQLLKRHKTVSRWAKDIQAIIWQAGIEPIPPQLSYPLPNPFRSETAIKAAWGAGEANLAQTQIRLAGALGGPTSETIANRAGDGWAVATTLGQTMTFWPGWV